MNTTITLNRKQIQEQIEALNNIKNIKQQIEDIAKKVDQQIESTENFLKLIEYNNTN